MTMVLLPQLSTYFIHNRVISLDSDLSATTPETCSHKFSTMTVELQRMISRWSLDEYDAGEDEDMHVFGSLKCCSHGALDSRANFLGTSKSYIMYLWEYLNAHDLQCQPSGNVKPFLPVHCWISSFQNTPCLL